MQSEIIQPEVGLVYNQERGCERHLESMMSAHIVLKKKKKRHLELGGCQEHANHVNSFCTS